MSNNSKWRRRRKGEGSRAAGSRKGRIKERFCGKRKDNLLKTPKAFVRITFCRRGLYMHEYVLCRVVVWDLGKGRAEGGSFKGGSFPTSIIC